MSNKKQSSVEWLHVEFQKRFPKETAEMYNNNQFLYEQMIEQAKAMHKQEIKDGYNQGYRDGEHDASNIPLSIGDVSEYNNAESYYNETFNI